MFAGTVLNAASASTLVAVVSDHGEMRLEHGTWQKGSLHEGSARVAFVLRPPRAATATTAAVARVARRVVSLIDVYATLIDAADGAPPRRDASRAGSLLPLLRAGADAAALGAEAGAGAVSEYHGPTAPTGACMLSARTPQVCRVRRALLRRGAFPPQLFDVEADEEERHDLAAVETETLSAMRAAMRERLDCQAADRAAKRHDYELYEEHGEGTALEMARACYAEPLDDDDVEKIQRWRVAAGREFGPASSSERIVENLFT